MKHDYILWKIENRVYDRIEKHRKFFNLSFQRKREDIPITEREKIYNQTPYDIQTFRKVNTYLDPKITLKKDKITFLRIVNSDSTDDEIKQKFNKYLNVKYNHITNPLSYNENMDKFIRQSRVVSSFLDDILRIGQLSNAENKILKENEELRKNQNIFQLLKLYRDTKNKRLKFEILRKLGLIDLVSRIEKNYPLEYTDFVANEVSKLFSIGMSLKKLPKKKCYIWLDENNEVRYKYSEQDAKKEYEKTCEFRRKRRMEVFPIEEITYNPRSTALGKDIELIEIRDKLRKNGQPYYTSFLEKMIRKNIEFPTQIHDTIGVRIVVKEEEKIPVYISALEKFLGGSSSRKKEKNTLHKFGREKLSPHSSEDYYVWKAIYDIALPHFTIKYLKEARRVARSKNMAELLSRRIEQMMKTPVNAVVEVQIQDFKTYALSLCKGSSTDHSKLKMNQIRKNSFYKLFPKEIYEKEIRTRS